MQSLSREEATARRREAAIMFAGIFTGESGARISSLPDEMKDGQSWNVFRVTFQGPDTYEFLVSPHEGALDSIRMVEDRRIRYIKFDGWHLVNGVEQPSTISILSSNNASALSMAITSSKANEEMAEQLFEPPSRQLRLEFSSKGNWSGWIPFKLFDGRRIYISAMVNGRPTQMLLDSGAEATVLDRELARLSDAAANGQIGVEGAGGSSSGGLAPGISITLGDLSVSNLTAITMDLSRVSKDVGIPLEAILGQEVFNELIVDIDFANNRIAFRDPAHFLPPSKSRKVKASPVSGNRLLQLSIGDKPAIPVFFDLGNGSPLDLFQSYWETQHLLRNRRYSKTIMGGAGGKQEILVSTIPKVHFAKETFRDLPVNFIPVGSTTENSDRVKGNVGLPLLNRFHVMTDFPQNCLFLLRRPAIRRAFLKERSGITVTLEGNHLAVSFVAPSSPAANAGWTIGDEITAVNGRPITSTAPLAEQAQWRYDSAGNDVTFTMSTGEIRQLRLRDYY